MAESSKVMSELMDVCVEMNSRRSKGNCDWDKMKELKKEEKEELVERLSALSASISTSMRSIAESNLIKDGEEEEKDDVRIVNGSIIDVSVQETSRRFERIGQRSAKRFKEENDSKRKKSNGDARQDKAFTERMASVFNEDLTELSESNSFTDMDASILTDLLACGAVTFRDLESSPVPNSF